MKNDVIFPNQSEPVFSWSRVKVWVSWSDPQMCWWNAFNMIRGSNCRSDLIWISRTAVWSPLVKRARSVSNFIKTRRFLTEIWWFIDFQNGGRPPSWILKICSFCHVALVDIPFCFLIQNFDEIGQSVDELWPKKWFSRWRPPPSWIFENFNFWSRHCNRVQYLM